MDEATTLELQRLGRDAGRDVAGDGAIEQVEVAEGVDLLDQPVYYFVYRIDQERLAARIGLIWTRLIQRLRDDLVARKDDHLPEVRIVDHQDWDKRHVAGAI